MPEENSTESSESNESSTASDIKVPESTSTPEDFDSRLKAAVQEQLKDIKDKLDVAYKARDEANAKALELEEKEQKREIERLKEEGKHREAFEQEMASERAKREAAEKRAIELTRDVELRSALSDHTFRNKNAQDMAFKEIAVDLIQDESGNWLHKSGTPITDYVKTFVSNEDNAFLLKQNVSTGAGSTAAKPNPDVSKPKSLFDLPTEEVLKLAAEGKLPHQQT